MSDREKKKTKTKTKKNLRKGPAVVPGLRPPVFGPHDDSHLEDSGVHHVGHHPKKTCVEQQHQPADKGRVILQRLSDKVGWLHLSHTS